MADNTEQNIVLKVDVNQADQSIKSFKAQLREAKEEAMKIGQQFGDSSKEFAEAAKRVANLKDEFQEFNATVDAFNPDNKMQALTSLAKGAVGAVQGVAGAMTFLGVESETASETIAKLQGLMAFSDALNSVDDIKNSFKNFATVLGLTKTATQGATVATTGFGTAFKAIGIGLLVSAIAALVANWDAVKDAVTGVFPALKDMGGMFDKVKQIAYGLGNAIIQYVAMPIKTIASLIKGDFKGAIEEVKNGMNVVANYQKGAAKEANKQRLDDAKEILKQNVEASEARLKILDKEGKNTDALQREIFNKKKLLYEKDSKEYKEVIADRELFEAGVRKRQADDAQKAADKARQAGEKAKQERAKELADQEAYDEKMRGIIAKGNATILDGQREMDAEKAKLAQDRIDGTNKLLDGKQNPTMDINGDLTPEQIELRAEMLKTLGKTETQIKLDNLNEEYKVLYKAAGNNEEMMHQLKKDYADKKAQIDIDNMKAVGDMAGQLGSVFAKQTVAYKALNTANALMNTYTGITEIWRAKSVLPEPFGTAQKVVATGIAAASGFAAVKNIMKVDVPGASSGGGSLSMSNSPVAPTLNGTTIASQGPQDVRVTNMSDKPVMAYIVDSELEARQKQKDLLNNLRSS